MQRVVNFHDATLRELAEMTAAAGPSTPTTLSRSAAYRAASRLEVITFADLYPPLAEGALLAGTRPGRCWMQPWAMADAVRFARRDPDLSGAKRTASGQNQFVIVGPAMGDRKRTAMTAPIRFRALLAPGTPAWPSNGTAFPKYNFIGGHNDARRARSTR